MLEHRIVRRTPTQLDTIVSYPRGEAAVMFILRKWGTEIWVPMDSRDQKLLREHVGAVSFVMQGDQLVPASPLQESTGRADPHARQPKEGPPELPNAELPNAEGWAKLSDAPEFASRRLTPTNVNINWSLSQLPVRSPKPVTWHDTGAGGIRPIPPAHGNLASIGIELAGMGGQLAGLGVAIEEAFRAIEVICRIEPGTTDLARPEGPNRHERRRQGAEARRGKPLPDRPDVRARRRERGW